MSTKKKSTKLALLPLMAVVAGILSLTAGVLYVRYSQTIDSQAAGAAQTTDRASYNLRMYIGLPTDLPLAGKWKTGATAALPVLFRNGTWFFFSSTEPAATPAIQITYGQAGDQPFLCDFDGDGVQTPAVYRNANWYIKRSVATGNADEVVSAAFLKAPNGSTPLCGDFDGDGKDEIAQYDRASGNLYLKGANNQPTVVNFPIDANAYFAPGKYLTYRGDRVTRFGKIMVNGSTTYTTQTVKADLIYMAGTMAPQQTFATLTVDSSSVGAVATPKLSDIQPVVADWNGDGRVDLSFRWKGQWYVKYSN